MLDSAVESFGLACDYNGKIIEIFYDNLGLGSFKIGEPFLKIGDEGSQEKALDFIEKIKNQDAVYDWEFTLKLEDELMGLHVSGFLVNQYILIFGAKSADDTFHFMEHLTQVNHEQTSALRGVMKYFTTHFLEQEAKEAKIYEELGRLNNDLTNAQRELTKKNIQLKQLNQQKEMLIKEVHHRVKNNLMIISSLLNLQSSYLKDEESKEIFKESQNRAKSMALIHERLYRSTDLKNIDFKEYITTWPMTCTAPMLRTPVELASN